MSLSVWMSKNPKFEVSWSQRFYVSISWWPFHNQRVEIHSYDGFTHHIYTIQKKQQTIWSDFEISESIPVIDTHLWYQNCQYLILHITHIEIGWIYKILRIRCLEIQYNIYNTHRHNECDQYNEWQSSRKSWAYNHLLAKFALTSNNLRGKVLNMLILMYIVNNI